MRLCVHDAILGAAVNKEMKHAVLSVWRERWGEVGMR